MEFKWFILAESSDKSEDKFFYNKSLPVLDYNFKKYKNVSVDVVYIYKNIPKKYIIESVEEDSHSGLVRSLGKRVRCYSLRGFESPILRNFSKRVSEPKIWSARSAVRCFEQSQTTRVSPLGRHLRAAPPNGRSARDR